MRTRDFLSSFAASTCAVVSAALLFVACGGNVVVDKPTGGAGGTGGVIGGTGGVQGGAGGAMGGAGGVAGSGCPAGSTACGNLCVNTKSDPFHCGGCMSICPSGVACVDGVCLVGEGGAPPGCPPDLTLCPDGGCYDLKNDPNHCGTCNFICSPPNPGSCVNGMCAAPKCLHCAEYINDNPPPDPVCPGTSADLYQQLITCVCVKKCAFQCGDNVCQKKPASQKCQDCVLDPKAGCQNEFSACANDL